LKPPFYRELYEEAARRAIRYIEVVGERRVAPLPGDLDGLAGLGGPVPGDPCDPVAVLAQLDEIGSPGTMATSGPRYFGFVTGGALPATVAASWLATAWDQIAGLQVMSPVSAKIEEIASGWLLELLGLPSSCGVGFVTGATMANFTALAAARHALLGRVGWNVENDGLFGAPPLKVVVGAEVHVSLLKALALLGLGRERVVRVPVDGQGRMRAEDMPVLDDRTIVCIQAGNVNTGAFDPAAEICKRAGESGAWVHVDGAFGLWAAAAPGRAYLAAGVSSADSWATDCHKWLNVPYDSGLAFVRRREYMEASMAMTAAAYLQTNETRQPCYYTPEASRRARGIEVWAAVRSLGRRGLAEMIERHCRLAERFATRLGEAGFEILNDVVLNQVLVSFGAPEDTRRVIERVQAGGVCWCAGTVWQGRVAMRISVSCWQTTEEDVDRSVEAMVEAAGAD
jgi:glutamate/tyrosine decarboxylase-like PLP-dependent enzyme